MNDVNFTQKIKQWFDSEHTDDNIREGAMMLLQINNNRHLYQQILLRPQKMLDHLVYELQKHYGYRTKGMTLDEVHKFDVEVTPLLQKAVDSTADADKVAAEVAPHLPLLKQKTPIPSMLLPSSPKANVQIMTSFPMKSRKFGRLTASVGSASRNSSKHASLISFLVTDSRD